MRHRLEANTGHGERGKTSCGLPKRRSPYIDLRAAGTFSDRIGFVGSSRYAEDREIAAGRSLTVENGTARTPDHFVANVGGNENGVMHSAMFPAT